MSASIKRLALIAALSLIAIAARADGIGNQGVLGQMIFGGIGGSLSQSGGGGGGSCTNGNLLLVYSDPCQLMSQMVGN